MELSEDDVLKILKIIDEANYDEIRLELGAVMIHVKKRAGPEVIPLGPSSGPPTTRYPQVDSTQPTSPVAAPSSTPHLPDQPAIPEEWVAVRSPMVGTFYRASAPGEKPFVEVGSVVSGDDTVCLVEVMKLFNSVKAGTPGTVAEVLVENGALVEHNQPLIWINPHGRP